MFLSLPLPSARISARMRTAFCLHWAGENALLIDILNERFGTEFKPGDQLFFGTIWEDGVADTNMRPAAMANTMEDFGYDFRKAREGLFIDRMGPNEETTV